MLVGLVLLVMGAVVGVLSGGPRAQGSTAIGLGAAAITYVIGPIVGATLGCAWPDEAPAAGVSDNRLRWPP